MSVGAEMEKIRSLLSIQRKAELYIDLSFIFFCVWFGSWYYEQKLPISSVFIDWFDSYEDLWADSVLICFDLWRQKCFMSKLFNDYEAIFLIRNSGLSVLDSRSIKENVRFCECLRGIKSRWRRLYAAHPVPPLALQQPYCYGNTMLWLVENLAIVVRRGFRPLFVVI